MDSNSINSPLNSQLKCSIEIYRHCFMPIARSTHHSKCVAPWAFCFLFCFLCRSLVFLRRIYMCLIKLSTNWKQVMPSRKKKTIRHVKQKFRGSKKKKQHTHRGHWTSQENGNGKKLAVWITLCNRALFCVCFERNPVFKSRAPVSILLIGEMDWTRPDEMNDTLTLPLPFSLTIQYQLFNSESEFRASKCKQMEFNDDDNNQFTSRTNAKKRFPFLGARCVYNLAHDFFVVGH